MLSIHSAEENDVIAQLFRATRRRLYDAGSGIVWLLMTGGSDAAEEGTWVWDDGTPFDYGLPLGSMPPWIFSDKSANGAQPDNAAPGPGEDCLNMWVNGSWNDIGCGTLQGMCMCYVELA